MFKKFMLVFVISLLQVAGTIGYGDNEREKNRPLRLDLGALSIPASLDFPPGFSKVQFATIKLTGNSGKEIKLIENGKSTVKSVDKLINAFLTVIFADLSYELYQIDGEGKIIMHLSRNNLTFRIRVDSSEFLKEMLRLHDSKG